MKQVKRAALYARVSMDAQHEGMQTREMLEMCEKREWTTTVFSDPGWSGGKERRPELDRLMGECRRRKFDVVVVYKFDRFARSLRQLVNALAEFDALGVQFVSVHEQIDTTTPHGRFFFQVFGAIAEFEREMIRARTRSGIAHARARGVRLGRPNKVSSLDTRYIAHKRAQGATWEAIAAELKVSIDTCQRAVKRTAKPQNVTVC